MFKGYVSSDSDDVEDLDEFYSEPPVKREEKPRPLPEIQNEKLRQKLDSAMKESQKISLFLKAAWDGDLNTLQELISLGVNVDCSENKDWTALLKSCGAGNFEVVQFLLEHGSNPNQHKELLTPLMVCCSQSLILESSKLQCVRLLLQHGANVNAKDKYGTTALMYASESGYEDIVSELLAAPDIKINMQDKEDLTALFYAVHSNNENITKKLLLAGSDVTLRDRYNRTAVDLALENDFKDLAKIFDCVEESGNDFTENKIEAEHRFLQQLPDSFGKGGFSLDTYYALESLNIKLAEDVSFPDFLNITDRRLYDLGVKLKFQREKILSRIHSYHLHPWKKSSIHEVKLGVPLCTEDAVAIIGDIAKHLTVANASLQYLDSRLTERMGKKSKDLETENDIIKTLTDIYQTAEKMNVTMPKILRHINQIKPDVMDDYIYPYAEKKKNKFYNFLWYSCGMIALGVLTMTFFSKFQFGSIYSDVCAYFYPKPVKVEVDDFFLTQFF